MSKFLNLITLVLAATLIAPVGAQSAPVARHPHHRHRPQEARLRRSLSTLSLGAMAQAVKDAMQFDGYDVKICHNCNAAAAPVIVSEARVPPPYKADPAVSVVMAPPNDPGLGPVDFGATAIQFLCQAYDGAGPYANHKPMTNLRLIANVDSRWFLIVAARADTGITDLSQVRQKKWPVRILRPRWRPHGQGHPRLLRSIA